jgi:hypothetical protein
MSRSAIILGIVALAIAVLGMRLSTSHAGPVQSGNTDTGLILPSIGL